jgi:predicted DNA-binding protein
MSNQEEEVKRTKWISFRLTEEEKSLMDYNASKHGYSRSKYIRSAVMGYKLESKFDNSVLKVILEFVSEHKAQGVNINQVAKKINQISKSNPDDDRISDLSKDIIELYQSSDNRAMEMVKTMRVLREYLNRSK